MCKAFNQPFQISLEYPKAPQFFYPDIFIIKSCMTNKLSCWMIWISAVKYTDPIRFSFQQALDERTQEMEKIPSMLEADGKKEMLRFFVCSMSGSVLLMQLRWMLLFSCHTKNILSYSEMHNFQWDALNGTRNFHKYWHQLCVCFLACLLIFFVGMYASGKHLITAARKPRELCDNFQMHLRIDKVAAVHLPSVAAYWFSALARHLA